MKQPPDNGDLAVMAIVALIGGRHLCRDLLQPTMSRIRVMLGCNTRGVTPGGFSKSPLKRVVNCTLVKRAAEMALLKRGIFPHSEPSAYDRDYSVAMAKKRAEGQKA